MSGMIGIVGTWGQHSKLLWMKEDTGLCTQESFLKHNALFVQS